MLTPYQEELLENLLITLDPKQTTWLSGYLQGLIAESPRPAATNAPVSKPQVDVYYATETGNAKALSLQLMKALKTAGFKTKSAAVNRLKPQDINKDHIAIFLASTHGEGDPPESAIQFFERIKQADAGLLADMPFAVLGLGDKTYEIFCGAATELAQTLTKLGGQAFQDIALFDVDYATHTPKWIQDTVTTLNQRVEAGSSSVASTPATPAEATTPDVRTGKGYTRLEPVKGRIKDIVNLNDHGSNKATYHIEIEYEDDVVYTPGDSVGIILPPAIAGDDLSPRLYSIASSPSLHQQEIHLTVALASHQQADGSQGFGLCSKYLADLAEQDEISFYIDQNHIFNLPADDQDSIMIGPGTGIAPFRSFIHERAERGASGRNWLFFGDQQAHCDFLYQAEWQEHLGMETLTRMDLAFSRDQADKIYVQDRLREQASTLVEWLENGAALYVCGSKDPMSRDVEHTLTEIIVQEKGLSLEHAADYLADLEEQGRYLKDVY